MRKWDAVTHGELVANIEYLKHNFDPILSRKVIELFHERMRDDEHVDYDALFVLMKHVFAQIMDSKSADQAFGLKRKKGDVRRKDTEARDMRAAAIVIFYLEKKASWEDAIAEAVERLNISESTAQRACKKYRAYLEPCPNNVVKQIAFPSPSE
ncbi:MAG: hypothetical protein V7693_10935 [Halopseudomonas sabulinigri]